MPIRPKTGLVDEPPPAPMTDRSTVDEAEDSDVSVAGAVWPDSGASPVAAAVPETDFETTEAPPVTDEQVVAALERVIEKVYGDRIEALLLETIEKTVSREIEKIRNALMADDDRSAG